MNCISTTRARGQQNQSAADATQIPAHASTVARRTLRGRAQAKPPDRAGLRGSFRGTRLEPPVWAAASGPFGEFRLRLQSPQGPSRIRRSVRHASRTPRPGVSDFRFARPSPRPGQGEADISPRLSDSTCIATRAYVTDLPSAFAGSALGVHRGAGRDGVSPTPAQKRRASEAVAPDRGPVHAPTPSSAHCTSRPPDPVQCARQRTIVRRNTTTARTAVPSV